MTESSPEWLQLMLEWIRANPGLAGLAIAAVAFLEGLAFVGILIPGIIILFGVGALVGLDVISLGTAWFWSSLGAVLGDGASFWLGYHYKQRLRDMWPFRRFRNLIHQGEEFFNRHGTKSVVIGRFVGPVRPVMPVVAGMMDMDLKKYIPANIIAAALWAPAYLLPGVVFGASLELARAVAFRLAILLVVVAVIIATIYWVAQQSYLYLAPRTSRMLGFALLWSHRHPRLGRLTRNLVDPSRPESASLALFAILLVMGAWAFATLLVTTSVAGGLLGPDAAVLVWFNQLRSPWADQLMATLASFGDQRVLIPASILTLAWLAVRNRRVAALHWAIACGIGALLALVLTRLIAWSSDASVPGGDQVEALMSVTMATIVYGYFAVLVAKELPRRRRIWPYVVASVLVGLILSGKLFFGAQLLSAMLTGLFLGVIWVTIIGIAYRRRVRRSFWMKPISIAFYLTVLITALANVPRHNDQLIDRYTQESPIRTLPTAQWLADGWTPVIPPARQLNLQWAGSLDGLRDHLLQAGWEIPAPANWEMAIKIIQPNPDIDSLPLLPASHAGETDELIMRKRIEVAGSDIAEQWVIRFWGANVQLDDGRDVHAGYVDRYTIRRVGWFFSYWGHTDEQTEAIEQVIEELPANWLDGPERRIHTVRIP